MIAEANVWTFLSVVMICVVLLIFIFVMADLERKSKDK